MQLLHPSHISSGPPHRIRHQPPQHISAAQFQVPCDRAPFQPGSFRFAYFPPFSSATSPAASRPPPTALSCPAPPSCNHLLSSGAVRGVTRVLSRDMRAHAVAASTCATAATPAGLFSTCSHSPWTFSLPSARASSATAWQPTAPPAASFARLSASRHHGAPPPRPRCQLAPLTFARRFQLLSLPVSQLGNSSADPSVVVDDLSRACGFGANEQARNLEYDSASSMVYISTQQ